MQGREDRLAKRKASSKTTDTSATVGYPPDKQEKATQTVLERAALLSAEWAAA
jgi:hypothetical protein